MRRYTNKCEDAIHNNQAQQMVDNTSQIARLGNRVLMAAKNEAENSEEPSFVQRVNTAATQLHSVIPPMVTHAKQVAMNPHDSANSNRWRDANDHLLDSVRAVGDAIVGVPQQQQNLYNKNNAVPSNNYYPQKQQQVQNKPKTPQPYSHNILEQVSARAPTSPIVHNRLIIREDIPAPPRPAPPVEISPAPRPPPPPEVDDEEETRAFWERYPLPGASSQPILSAAHNLHQVSIFFLNE